MRRLPEVTEPFTTDQGAALTAWLLWLSLLNRPGVVHAAEPPPARETYACAALLRHADPAATWEDRSLLTTLEELRRAYPIELAEPLREVVRDLKGLPAAAFPVKQVLVDPDQIRRYLYDADVSAARAEDAHDADRARKPFAIQPRFGTHGLTAATGLAGGALAMASSVLLVDQGFVPLGLVGVLAAAACANGLLAPAACALYLDILNSDLIEDYARGRRRIHVDTTARYPAEQIRSFNAKVTNILDANQPRLNQVVWMRARIRLPMSASDRPARAGSPRAPTAGELGAAVRHSGEFRFPHDARVIDLDQYFYFDPDRRPVLMTFIRER